MTESVLDREFQRKMLLELQGVYPSPLSKMKIQEFKKHPAFIVNLAYLGEQGFVNFKAHEKAGVLDEVALVKITAEGLDFLSEDGGLTAIKKTITVRPDVESFLNLLKVHAESLPEKERRGFLDAIAQFSKPILQGVIQGALTAHVGKCL